MTDQADSKIDETIFERWCHKHMPELLRQYGQSSNIEDLGQDAWTAAYQYLRYCQLNNCPVDYTICQLRIIDRLKYRNAEYNSGGITYGNNQDIDLENDIEIKAIDNAQPISSNIDRKLKKWLS